MGDGTPVDRTLHSIGHLFAPIRLREANSGLETVDSRCPPLSRSLNTGVHHMQCIKRMQIHLATVDARELSRQWLQGYR